MAIAGRLSMAFGHQKWAVCQHGPEGGSTEPMSNGTSVGKKPHVRPEAPTHEKSVDDTRIRLRCPDCGYSESGSSRVFFVTRQRRVPCPNCNRMMGLSQQEVSELE